MHVQQEHPGFAAIAALVALSPLFAACSSPVAPDDEQVETVTAERGGSHGYRIPTITAKRGTSHKRLLEADPAVGRGGSAGLRGWRARTQPSTPSFSPPGNP